MSLRCDHVGECWCVVPTPRSDPPRDRTWTVEARQPGPLPHARPWTIWTDWVDLATAEAEKANALDEGYQARIVRAS